VPGERALARTACSPKKLVLAVIDSLKPDMLDQAVAEGEAPALGALLEHGTYIRDCVSTFPSVTPVASAAISTGYGPGEHHIPSMNWFHRGEERYVEYGSSLSATRAFGIVRSLYDTVYNMNLAHLTRAHRTVFEHLDDAGLRTACTTYLIYRGRTRHDPSGASVYRRIAEAAQFRHSVYGARELFYADLFDSRDTGCTSALGMPGQRDRHTACVGAYLVEHDLFDFLLFSLPDNDTHSHKAGPDGQVRSIAEADRALERIMHVAGGAEAFLEEHAVIVMSDHSQTAVESGINLSEVLSDSRVLTPGDPAPTEAELAACPSARSAMVYALDEGRRDELVRLAADTLFEADGVELVITRENGAALVRSKAGELRFGPGDEVTDRRGLGWAITGDEAVLELSTGGGRVDSATYPDALGRVWSALSCPHAGDVLVSAELGYEFVDWGGADHVGGGSHGSLHRDDSEGVLLLCGLDPPEREQWSLTDVTPLVLEHFGVPLAR
jgi:type I phosphodiesterase/nucleotide pyrophosphatase